MRQLIARIDDELHSRLKARAAAERRSVNSLVRELLEREVPARTRKEQFRARVEAAGLLAEVPPPAKRPPSRDQVMKWLRGDAGRAVIEALEADRTHR